MQRISLAPELSATFSLDSCWLIASPPLRLLDDLDQAPALALRERPRLHHPHHVAGAGLVALVVGVEGPRSADHLLVGGMAADDVDLDGDRFLALVGDDDALADLGSIGIALGDRGAGAALALGLGSGATLTAGGSLALAVLGALGGTLLDAEL